MKNKSFRQWCRILSLTLALAVMPGTSLSASAETVVLSDVQGTPYETAVTRLVEDGVISGYEDGTFRPDNYISRAEVSTIIASSIRAWQTESSSAGSDVTDSSLMATLADGLYADLEGTSWAKEYIGVTSMYGITGGYGQYIFGPQRSVTYDELITMVVRACGASSQVPEGTWPDNYVQTAQALGLYDGLIDFQQEIHGGSPASRGGTAIIIANGISLIRNAAAQGYEVSGTAASVLEAFDRSYSISEAGSTARMYSRSAQDAALHQTELKRIGRGRQALQSYFSDSFHVTSGSSLTSVYDRVRLARSEDDSALYELAAQFAAEQADSSYQAEVNALLNNTEQQYYSLLNLQKQSRVCKDSYDRNLQISSAIGQRYTQGSLSLEEVSLQESRTATALERLTQARISYMQSQKSFAEFMGLPNSTYMILTTPFQITSRQLPTADEAVAEMEQNSLQWKYIDYLDRIADAQISYLRTSVTDDASREEAQQAYILQRSESQKSRESMQSEVRVQYTRIANASKTALSRYSELGTARNHWNDTLAAFEAGSASCAELQAAEDSYTRAEFEYAAQVTEYNVAVSAFTYSTGIGMTGLMMK